MKRESFEQLVGGVAVLAIAGYALAWRYAPAPVKVVETKIVERVIVQKPQRVSFAPETVPVTSPDADDILSMTSYPDAKAGKSKSGRSGKGKFNKTNIGQVGVIVIRK